jgi:hypothetical protein
MALASEPTDEYRQAIVQCWRAASELTAAAISLTKAWPSTGEPVRIGAPPWRPEDDFISDLHHFSVLLKSRIGGEGVRTGLNLSAVRDQDS